MKTRLLSEAIGSLDLAVFEVIESWSGAYPKDISRPTGASLEEIQRSIENLSRKNLIVPSILLEGKWIINVENPNAISIIRAMHHYTLNVCIDDFQREMKKEPLKRKTKKTTKKTKTRK